MQQKILLIGCGGTISCAHNENKQAVPTLTAKDLIAAIPQAEQIAEIDCVQLAQLSSSSMDAQHILKLCELIKSQQYDAYIITQGTDSIEETAFALDLIYQGSQPVIITGAMRHDSLVSADGSGNILAAIQVAVNPKASDKGVLVVMNETIHCALNVSKNHTSRLDAFSSGEAGILGYLSEDKVIWINQPLRNYRLDSAKLKPQAGLSVPILKTYSGDDGQVFKMIAESGKFKAVVIEGLGAGHVSKPLAELIEQNANKMVVLISSRTDNGCTYFTTYGGKGSEIELINDGAIMAATLPAVKARILVQYLLLSGCSIAQIRATFDLFA